MQFFRQALEQYIQLSDAEWNDIEPSLFVKEISQGHHCLTANAVCNSLNLVKSGIFRSYYLKNAREVNIDFHAKGSFATSFSSFASETPADCFIQALEDSTLVCIHKRDLQRLYSRIPRLLEFGRRLNESLLVQAQRRTESFILHTAKERYLNFVSSSKELHNKVPLYHIATYLGIEGPSLSRIRKEISLTNA